MKNIFSGQWLIITFFTISLFIVTAGFTVSVYSTSAKLSGNGDSTLCSDVETHTTISDFSAVNKYKSMMLASAGLSMDAFTKAITGFEKLIASGNISNTSVLTIIDFSLPSTVKRLFVIDLENNKLLYHTLVAHGRNSGKEMAMAFSNKPSSYKSSPGFYSTGEIYSGKNGVSLKLIGLEAGINNNALARGIVMHGAAYVNEALGNAQGYIGRSEGCPAVPMEYSGPIIKKIMGGSCLFIYHPAYTRSSALLRD